MMESVAVYLFRLVCCALVCSLILSITGSSGPGGRLRVMLCGLYLVFAAISPLRELDLSNLVYTDPEIARQARSVAEEGSLQAREAMSGIIKQQCETYILTKAAELSLELDAEVELDEESCVPVRVLLTGRPTPHQRQALSDYITQTLGIERSGILWNP